MRGQRTRPPIDWAAVRHRLAQAMTASAAGAESSPDNAKRILEARARVLAAKPAATSDPGPMIEVVTFSLAGERYGLETKYVSEVRRRGALTPMPRALEWVAGITPLRGELLPLFDLHGLLGLKPAAPASPAWIIVVGTTKPEFGLLADHIQGVGNVRLDEITTIDTAFGTGQRHIRGTTSEALQILDGSTLIAAAYCLDDSAAHQGIADEISI